MLRYIRAMPKQHSAKITKLLRPYRVAMSRAEPRYIEPDEIYVDMARGKPTKMPVQFPYTWTPVNGLGTVAPASSVSSQGFLDDLKESIKDITENLTEDAKERAAEEAEDILRSGPGAALLQKIEEKAAEGVTKVVKENAPNLIMLAVAGGAVGGALSAKLGKTGTILALATAGWAAYQLMTISTAPPAAETPRKKIR